MHSISTRSTLVLGLALAASGCQTGLEAGTPLAVSPTATDGAPLPQTLSLTISPMHRGEDVIFEVTGAPPGAGITLARSRGEIGPGLCPPALGGECLDITQGPVGYTLLNMPPADAAGESLLVVPLNAGAPLGLDFVWQAVAFTPAGPQGSNPIANVITDACAPWWPGEDLDGDGAGDLPYRFPIDVTNDGTVDRANTPVVADVDFRAKLDAAFDSGTLDPASIRVIAERCDGSFPEVPAQFEDGLTSLDEKTNHLDPLGDEAGVLAFLHDTDGDLSTVEPLPAGETQRYWVYYAPTDVTGGTVPAPSYVTDLTVGPDILANDAMTATFDASRGGMLDDLTIPGSPVLASQADSCCGNSMSFWFGTGWVDPQDGPADVVEVLADGPILGAIRVSGSRLADDGTQIFGAYDYGALYWAFAGRAELWHSVTQTFTLDSTNEHPDDAADGFRPLETRHIDLAALNPTFDAGTADQPFLEMASPEWAIFLGMPHPVQFLGQQAAPIIGANNNPLTPYMAFYGSDTVDVGGGTPQTFPAGMNYFQDVGFVMLPYGLDASGTLSRPDYADAVFTPLTLTGARVDLRP